MYKLPEFPVLEPQLAEYPAPTYEHAINPVVCLLVGFSGVDESHSLSLMIGGHEQVTMH